MENSVTQIFPAPLAPRGFLKCCHALVALFLGIIFFNSNAAALTNTALSSAKSKKELLIKFKTAAAAEQLLRTRRGRFSAELLPAIAKTRLAARWLRLEFANTEDLELTLRQLKGNSQVLALQPNYQVHVIENESQLQFAPEKLVDLAAGYEDRSLNLDGTSPLIHALDFPAAQSVSSQAKPQIPLWSSLGRGPDPDFGQQWGLLHIGVQSGWQTALGDGVVVAVIDSGVDYTHEDLSASLWQNPGETGRDARGYDRATNQIDDDANGYVDDVIGWDFVANDNKPFDVTAPEDQLENGGGNAGHGTHCAGTIAAQAGNGIGIAGIAPRAKVMVLRFMNESGDGDTAAAIKAIHYAVQMGAKILSNSWGTQGEDPAESQANQALRDAIHDAQEAGVLFIAAAGNGLKGVGYDNDSDPKPMFPATYNYDNIISVAAIDSQDHLATFSNWGKNTVHIAAPGVAIFSTMVGNRYGSQIYTRRNGTSPTWNGTSMAAPFVSGAAALYWSKYPNSSYADVKRAIINSARILPDLQSKLISGGELDIAHLMSSGY